MDAMVRRIETAWVRLLDGAALTMMAVLVLVIIWSVLGRQLFRISVPWSEEIGSGLLLWMVCLGAAAAWYRRAHIAIDVVLRRLGLKAKFATLIAIELGSILLFVLILIGSYSMMSVSANNATTALNISYSYLYLALVIGVGSMTFFSVAHLIRLVVGGPSAANNDQDGGEWNTFSSS